MSTVEIHRQSKVTRSPTMCRMNTCKPSVSTGHSCNTLVQRLPRPCIWYLSVATLAPRWGQQYVQKCRPKCHTWNPKCGPKQKESQRNLYFFPTWESARVYFWWIIRPQMNQSSAKNHGFGKMVGMDLTRRMGFLWRLPGMVSGKHEEHNNFFMFFPITAKGFPQQFHKSSMLSESSGSYFDGP